MNAPATTALAEYRAALAAGDIDRQDRKTPWEKLREKPSSRTLAIAAMCAGCMGWGEGQERPAGLVRDIRGCTARGCALFNFRPYRGPAPADEVQDATLPGELSADYPDSHDD